MPETQPTVSETKQEANMDLPGFLSRSLSSMIGQSPVFGLLAWMLMIGMPAERANMLAELKEMRAREVERTKEIAENQRVITVGFRELATEVRFLAESRRRSEREPAKGADGRP